MATNRYRVPFFDNQVTTPDGRLVPTDISGALVPIDAAQENALVALGAIPASPLYFDAPTGLIGASQSPGNVGNAPVLWDGVTPALRQVADRSNYPYYNLAGVKQVFGRSCHRAYDTVTALQLGYVNASGPNETPGTGTETVSCVIEYPLGVINTQVTWGGGNVYGDVLPGTRRMTDLVTLNTPIPRFARFRVRTFKRNDVGGICMNAGCNAPNGQGDEIINYTGTAGTSFDFTMGSPVAGFMLPDTVKPTLILAYTAKRSLAIIGDSRTTGQISGTASDFVSDTNGWIGVSERAVGRRGACANFSAPSDLLANFIGSTGALRRDMLQYFTDVYSGYCINDLSQGAATILANLQTLRGMPNLVGKSFGVGTMAPYVATSDNLMTLTGQTPNANDAVRIALNTAFRNGGSCADYVVEIADFFESSRNSGTWKLYANVRTTAADGTMTAGSNILTSASANFTPADTGHKIMVPGAGTSGATLKQVMRYISPTQVSLWNLANNTIQNAVTSVTTSACQIGAFDYSIDGLHEAAPELPAFQLAVQLPTMTF